MEIRQGVPRGPAPAVDDAGLDDAGLVQALRDGDEARFTELVERLAPAMLHVASGHVPSRAVAEDVVQETWLAVLGGLDRFEGRSSVRTWVFAILGNIARSRGARERRSVPFSSAFPDGEAGPTVDARRFHLPGHEWPGHWDTPPRPWELPESALLSQEVRGRLRAALDTLPPRQRAVVSLRDIEGCEAEEVCGLLEIAPGNQRVLLHRGRAKLRQVLEDYVNEGRP